MRKSKFLEVFGDSPRMLVFDFLLDNAMLDFHKSDIAEQTSISRSTLDKFLKDIVKYKMIKKSRTIGRAQMYSVNRKNVVIRSLLSLDRALIRVPIVIQAR